MALSCGHQQFSGSNRVDPKIRKGKGPRQWSSLMPKGSREREVGILELVLLVNYQIAK